MLLADTRQSASFAGYAPCLAASKTLHSAGVLQEASPVKSGGQPGTAFSLVYGKVTDRVWETLYSVDGVLADWIRYKDGHPCPQNQGFLQDSCPVARPVPSRHVNRHGHRH